jgi:hypothetical protein
MSETNEQKTNENILGVNPEDYRTCKRCKRLKHISEYRPIPGGRKAGVCSDCQAEKLRETRVLGKDDTNQRAWIIGELIKQYRTTDKQTDKIRCLEALAKLLPPDSKTPLDDPNVIQSIMKSLAAKKKKATELKEVDGAGTEAE